MKAEPLILQMKYADIVKEFAQQVGISLDEALKFFYSSRLYQLIKDGVSDMHCMSVGYLADDLELEWNNRNIKEK